MQSDPGPVVVIGLQQIYENVVETKAQLQLLVAQHTEQARDLSDHEGRLRALERARWPLPSLAALLSVVSLALALYVVAGG